MELIESVGGWNNVFVDIFHESVYHESRAFD